MSYSVALNNWLKRKRSNEPPYVISYRLLIHIEALRVIFGQIQGDYINFTKGGRGGHVEFSAGVENFLSLCLEVLKKHLCRLSG